MTRFYNRALISMAVAFDNGQRNDVPDCHRTDWEIRPAGYFIPNPAGPAGEFIPVPPGSWFATPAYQGGESPG